MKSFEVEETESKNRSRPRNRTKKPMSKPAAPEAARPFAPNRREEKPPPALMQPVEGSTADDFVDLEPIDTAPAGPRGTRWKTDERR